MPASESYADRSAPIPSTSTNTSGLPFASPRRLETLKELPTLSESGLPGFSVSVWHALYAPKGTPKPVVDKLIAALQAAVQNPTFKTRLEELGAEPVPLAKANPEALRTHLAAEIKKWDPIFKKAGVRAD